MHNFVTWSNNYSVSVSLIDSQHKRLIKLTNSLYAVCGEKNSDKRHTDFLKCVQDAVDYTGYHFGTEEIVMQKLGYPFYEKHYKEHQDFVAKVVGLMDNLKTLTYVNPVSFVHFLKFWVLNHIAKTDKDMGNYIMQQRQNNALSHITLKIKKVRSVVEDPLSRQRTVSYQYKIK
ncbi:MAG: bacteriohemerythrin [Spirochaetaceae bacterium]|jgi:hemerythrin-like metal-binding protein|nr:bacteriohemerythrin [Spirochaetaceae bacterium]